MVWNTQISIHSQGCPPGLLTEIQTGTTATEINNTRGLETQVAPQTDTA